MTGKPNASHAKGAKAERDVARYLRDHGMWMAERYLREGRTDDKGDIEGVPWTTVQVKYVAQPSIQSWIKDTIKQRDNAGTPFCLLVVRIKYKAAPQWDAYMPFHQVAQSAGGYSEAEAWSWLRMDLRLAVEHLKVLTAHIHPSPSDPSLSTTVSPSRVMWAPVSAPSTENPERPSATT
jgi:hypothetical protein